MYLSDVNIKSRVALDGGGCLEQSWLFNSGCNQQNLTMPQIRSNFHHSWRCVRAGEGVSSLVKA